MSEIKKLFGIDSFYFFIETNENYDDLFLDIVDQIEDIKGLFAKKEIEYEKRDINIKINDIPFEYIGKSEGFYWFKDLNEYFRIGFKDYKENRRLNNIRVQLQGNGIYSIGINSIMELLKDMLKEYVTNYMPITRADLNCFIQYDFSFVDKNMFSTKKKKYSTISEIGNSNTTQTLYVGKEPFKLRLYNKSLELKQSKKFELMNEYFSNSGFDLEETIFNVEFQMHRSHLRQYNVQTVDELLSNAKNLFQTAMDDIRLLDMESVSQDRLKNNKYQANTHPIWEEIKQGYDLKDFLQSSIPLERLKRKISIYDENKFEFEYITLLRKAFINSLFIDVEFLETLYSKAKESLNKTTTQKEMKKKYIDIEIIHSDNKKEKLRQFDDGTIITPLSVVSVSELQDYELHRYLEKVQENLLNSQKDKDIYEVTLKEAIKRGLIPNVSANEVHHEI